MSTIDVSHTAEEEIPKVVLDFINKTFFARYPHLKEKTSVIIVSSYAEGFHDAQSDIDVKFVFPGDVLDQYRQEFLQYEQEIADRQSLVQFVLRDSYGWLKRLSEFWDDDTLIRDIAQGIIIHDPEGALADIKRRFTWYPPEIYREKVKWLYSNLVFQTEHFLTVTAKRQDHFFSLVIKGRLLECCMGITFLLNNKYPPGKKIYIHYQELPDVPKGLRKIVDDLLHETNHQKELRLARKAQKLVEDELLSKGLIPKESKEYWMKRKSNHPFHFPLIPL